MTPKMTQNLMNENGGTDYRMMPIIKREENIKSA